MAALPMGLLSAAALKFFSSLDKFLTGKIFKIITDS
jgi:hypothetical protein